jgi:6,7-dimethyl-8-ribityllumazine synthase
MMGNIFMPQTFQGHGTSPTDRFAIVVSRYNENITGKLLAGAVETLQKQGVPEEMIDIAWVPGAWGLPLIAQQFAITEKYAAVICLGAVIKGETTHDEHINRQVSQSLGNLGLEFNVPIAFGLLTCNSLEQAIHRSGGNVGNKGVECAEAALEMASLLRKLVEIQGE